MISQIVIFSLISFAVAQYVNQDKEMSFTQGYEVTTPEAKTEPYSFEYDIKDDYGGSQSRREESDGRNVKGSYGYTDFTGLYRKVDYVADEKGFRAYVKTNEPGIGTDSQNPADVQIQAYASPIQYEGSASNEKENVYSAPAEQPESQPVASYETVPGGSFQSQEYRSASEEAYLTEYKSERKQTVPASGIVELNATAMFCL